LPGLFASLFVFFARAAAAAGRLFWGELMNSLTRTVAFLLSGDIAIAVGDGLTTRDY
jgi:hypothetical protein